MVKNLRYIKIINKVNTILKYSRKNLLSLKQNYNLFLNSHKLQVCHKYYFNRSLLNSFRKNKQRSKRLILADYGYLDLILFPSSYFNVSKVDEDLQAEYNAVKATGLFDVILFGYDKWFEEDQLVIKVYLK